MKRRLEIISDMGESYGNWTAGRPEEVLKLINTASVACGFHAGDPSIMHQTLKWCKEYNVGVGAHCGFPDLLGFGRRYMAITPEEARDYIIYQIGALRNFAESVGVKVRSANTHGAFYIWASESEEHAKAVLDGIKTLGRDLVAIHWPSLPDSPFREAMTKSGIRVVKMFFPGLTYKANGEISVQRKYIADPEKEAQLVMKWLKTGKVETVEGSEIELKAESISVHGDMPNAPEVISAIRMVLEKEEIELRSALL